MGHAIQIAELKLSGKKPQTREVIEMDNIYRHEMPMLKILILETMTRYNPPRRGLTTIPNEGQAVSDYAAEFA